MSKPTCVMFQPTCVMLQPTCAMLQPTCVMLQPTSAMLQPTWVMLQPTETHYVFALAARAITANLKKRISKNRRTVHFSSSQKGKINTLKTKE